MVAVLVGFVVGVLLAALRAPLGVELLQLPATSAATAAGYRAAALGTLALGFAAAAPGLGPRLPAVRLLVGVLLGFALRGLRWERDAHAILAVLAAVFLAWVLADLRPPRPSFARAVLRGLAAAGIVLAVLLASEPERPGEALFLGLLALGAMVVLGRTLLFAKRPAERAVPSAGEAAEPALGGLTGLALAGAGAAIALEGLGRHLRLLTGGLAQDDALVGTLLLLLALVGAASFRQAFQGRGTATLAPALALAATALACFASLRSIGQIASPFGLDQHLRWAASQLRDARFGLGDHGTLLYDVVVSLPALALPGILLGAALCGCRSARQIAAVAIGAAAGIAAAPALMSFDLELGSAGAAALARQSHAAELVSKGARIAALGALLAIALGCGLARPRYLLGSAVALLFGAAAFLLEARPTPILSPWELRPASPSLVLDAPEGLITVERKGVGIENVTLDRRPLSPTGEHEALDRAQIESAFLALPSELRSEGAARILLIGQLTPERARTLLRLGAVRVDRTASWHRAMPLLESHLFVAAPELLPAGEVLAPRTARERIASGAYDLVLAPAVPGDAPATRNLGFPLDARGSSPAGTVAVVWLDTRSYVAHVELGRQVLPATADLADLAVAIVYGGGKRADGPPWLAAGDPLFRPDPIDRLRLRADARLRENRAHLARRLAGASSGDSSGPLTNALAHFYRAQRPRSAFESPAEQIVLPKEVLELIRRAGVAASEPDPFLRKVVESIAAILRGKRWVEEIDEHIAPIAERHFPWPALEEALTYADLELLDPEAAADRMTRLLSEGAGTAEQWALLGESQAQAGAGREAAASFWRALELDPDNRALRRRLTIQLLLVQDAEGAAMAADLLLESPGDLELQAYLEAARTGGPFPPLHRGYPAVLGLHRHDEH